MSHSNDRHNQVRKDYYQDGDGNVHTEVTRTSTNSPLPNEVPYRDGYVNGQIAERRLREQDRVIRDNDNAARGLLLGIVVTSLLGLIIGTLFFLNREEAPVPVAPVIVPSASPEPAASQAPAPRQETTIIERTVDRVVPVPQTRVVPVPQQQSPAPAPNVNINVPSSTQAPAATTAPTTVPTTAPTTAPDTTDSTEGTTTP